MRRDYAIPAAILTFALFAGWLTLAAVLYVTYARKHSRLRKDTPAAP